MENLKSDLKKQQDQVKCHSKTKRERRDSILSEIDELSRSMKRAKTEYEASRLFYENAKAARLAKTQELTKILLDSDSDEVKDKDKDWKLLKRAGEARSELHSKLLDYWHADR